MTDITFKVAPRGEGKTKWLLEIANKFANEHNIYLYTQEETEYSKFCEKYFHTFNQICPVRILTKVSLTDNDIVLVDNLFNQDSFAGDINFLQRSCYRLFVTLEGINEHT